MDALPKDAAAKTALPDNTLSRHAPQVSAPASPDGQVLTDAAAVRAMVEVFAGLAVAAGAKIMSIWAARPQGRLKADHSPVCDADEAAEHILLSGLALHYPDIPVVSEEAVARGEIPKTGQVFILVDPLDGTKEFLSDNAEFTVNIALIIDQIPAAGVVYAPASGQLWMGGADATCCTVPRDGGLPELTDRRAIHGRRAGAHLTALVSRSHPDPTSEDFLARIGIAERRCAGSSLKFCLLAEGEGDVYPRFGPTMQWDVAAGDAVLRAAGGIVVDDRGQPFRYGPGSDGFRNGPFVAWSDATSERVSSATLR